MIMTGFAAKRSAPISRIGPSSSPARSEAKSTPGSRKSSSSPTQIIRRTTSSCVRRMPIREMEAAGRGGARRGIRSIKGSCPPSQIGSSSSRGSGFAPWRVRGSSHPTSLPRGIRSTSASRRKAVRRSSHSTRGGGRSAQSADTFICHLRSLGSKAGCSDTDSRRGPSISGSSYGCLTG
jgi:hypothetical protein